ncbi:hypothetical protein [Photobacterium leiognathi]|uniref:hypothetical protein n=1 Tax=Photobacterium leiognathi TaxID=553611 RepID=UPI00273875A9|nr:hypothetical protein [Photobacterium leiognathi]
MPFIATCASLSDAVHLIPQIVKQNVPLTSRSDLRQLTAFASQIVKREVLKERWSAVATTTYIVALTDDNQLYFQAYHLNDDDMIGAYDVIGQSGGIIPSGFDPERHEDRKMYWREQLTQAILPSGSRTKAQRLEAVLEVFQGAFGECSTLNEFVSPNFDYCVINKSDRSITFNGTPPAFN